MATRQPAIVSCANATGLSAWQFNIPSDWPSGVYLGKLTQVNVPSPTGSYVIFVVRDDRQCDFLFKCSETTWSAYNGWPDNFSLYDFHGEPPKVGYWGPGLRVSFDRPYAMSQPWYMQHEPERCNWMIGASQFLIFEYPLLFWMESRGLRRLLPELPGSQRELTGEPATEGESAPGHRSRRILFRLDARQLAERRGSD